MSINFIILGPPGSGKGTQAKKLAQELGLIYFGTGDLMRDEIENGTAFGLESKKVIEEGKLVDDALVEKFVDQRLNELEIQKGIVFDGYPRTIGQARHLEKFLKEKKFDHLRVFNLVAKSQSLIARMQKRRICQDCGKIFRDAVGEGITACDQCRGQLILRDDDKPEVLKHRIDIYDQQTKPLIDFFQGKGVLINIDGEPSIEAVWEEIKSKLDD